MRRKDACLDASALVCSHLVVSFLEPLEVGVLQIACSELDNCLADPDARVELLCDLASSRAVILAAPTLEHIAVDLAAGARVVFHGFDDHELPLPPPSLIRLAAALRMHPTARALVDAPCGCQCSLSGRRAAAIRYLLCDTQDCGVRIAWDRISVTGHLNSRRPRDHAACKKNVATVYLQLREGEELYEYPTTRQDSLAPARVRWQRRAERPARPRRTPPKHPLLRFLWYARRLVLRLIFVLKWELGDSAS